MRRYALLGYFVLAFALSWSIWPLTRLNPGSAAMLPFGPLLAALIVAPVVGGWRGLRALLSGIVRWRVSPRYYVAALLLPAAPVIAAVAANVLLGASAPSAAEMDGWWYVLPASLASILLINGPLGEEPGWRGFALPRLQARFGVLPAALLLGVIWAAWHLPLALSGPTTDQRPPLQFALSVVAMSVAYAWLAARTRGSVLLAILMHAFSNTVAAFFLRMYEGDPAYARLWWLYAAAWVVVALVLASRGLVARDAKDAARDQSPAAAPAIERPALPSGI